MIEAVQHTSDELCAAMQKALDLINELVDISKAKERYLTAGDIESLRTATEKEEDIMVALGRVEKDRILKADALSQAIGLFNTNLTLKDIIGQIPDNTVQERLSGLRKGLLESADRLSASHELLTELLGLQMSYTDYMLNMIYTPKSKNLTYDIQGSRNDDSGSLSRFDLHI